MRESALGTREEGALHSRALLNRPFLAVHHSCAWCASSAPSPSCSKHGMKEGMKEGSKQGMKEGSRDGVHNSNGTRTRSHSHP